MSRSPFGFTTALEPEEIPVDRICQRWAVSIVDSKPNLAWDRPAHSPPPPFDPDTATVIDQIICKCPKNTNKFLHIWYRSNAPTEAIARALQKGYGQTRMGVLKYVIDMDEAGVYHCWHLTLNYLRVRIELTGYQPLINLLKIKI